MYEVAQRFADHPQRWSVSSFCPSLTNRWSPSAILSSDEVEGAAVMIVAGFRELGHEVILLPDGVWDLTSLADGEDLAFARAILLTLLEPHKLEVLWEE